MKQYDPQTARDTILKRTPPDEFPVSERVMDSIEKLFGERLTAEQAVTRILKEVRMNGDSALQSWTKRLDSIDRKPAPVSKELIQAAYDSLPPAQRDALEKAAYGEAGLEAFYAKFRAYFPSHSDQIFSAIPGLVKNSTPGDKATIYNLQTWHMVNTPGTKRSVRDSLDRIYFEKVTSKIPEILSERHMQHYFTADSHEYVILTEVAGLTELGTSLDKYDEMEKAAWPDEAKRKAFFKPFDDFFSYHSDKLYHSVPGLIK